MPALDRDRIAQGAADPASQQTRPHGGGGAVHDAGQGVLIRAVAAEGRDQLQVAPRGGVQDHRVVAALGAQAAQVGQGGALGVLDVLQQTARGTDGEAQVRATEAAQIAGAELIAQQPLGAVGVE